jgi:predicted HicB family RNase H-like nuclease
MVELKTETITVRIRPSVKRVALRRAKEEGRSLANYLERLIQADAQDRSRLR